MGVKNWEVTWDYHDPYSGGVVHTVVTISDEDDEFAVSRSLISLSRALTDALLAVKNPGPSSVKRVPR